MSYIKTENMSTYVNESYNGFGFCPSSTLNGSSSTRSLLKWQDITRGSANPNRRHQIARGDNASTDYYKTKHEVSIPGASCSVYWTEQAWSCPGKKRGMESRTWNFGALSLEALDPSSISLSTADNIARQKAFQAIRNIQTSFQGGQFVGELGETLRMIKGGSRSIYRQVLDYATGAKKRHRKPVHTTAERWAKDWTKRTSDSWLQTTLGIIPALSDVRNASEALEKRFNRFEESYPFKGNGTQESVVTTYGLSSKSDRLKIRFEKHRVTQARVTYYGRVASGVLGSRALFEARQFGFDPSSFLPTMWEIIPYSWLVDYFTNCGEVISSWSTMTSGVRWTSSSSKRTYITHCTGVKWALDDVKSAMGAAYNTFKPVGTVSSLGRNRVARTEISRTRAVTLEPPRLQFEIPGTSMKWLNMAALAAARSLS